MHMHEDYTVRCTVHTVGFHCVAYNTSVNTSMTIHFEYPLSRGRFFFVTRNLCLVVCGIGLSTAQKFIYLCHLTDFLRSLLQLRHFHTKGLSRLIILKRTRRRRHRRIGTTFGLKNRHNVWDVRYSDVVRVSF